ncbi:cysteine hydrolase family protein [Mesoterricola silvestris]|uniref:Isochorismatase n=1 Tax=Mesoterricola silvestris TaxID=2927979 RepID=A0AA48K858_9BACT|nr:cysteine hydrolase family protein [Mesoterricola silvestris]BDU71901.1 isochorismatase [Mesoterricola silvestris]
MTQALVIIDVQNDYFPGGAFPLWNPEAALANTEKAMGQARAQGVPVILVQHLADGPSPFFNEGTPGARIHPRILAAAPGAPVIVKRHADAFHGTTLDRTLRDLGATGLKLAGMMTHNCVTHTALSRAAEPYAVTVLGDCCATVSEILHRVALNALSVRVEVPTA